MKNRDFGDFEYGVFKVIKLIYIYAYLPWFYAHLRTLINQEPLMKRSLNPEKIILNHRSSSAQNFNVVACLVFELLGSLFYISFVPCVCFLSL